MFSGWLNLACVCSYCRILFCIVVFKFLKTDETEKEFYALTTAMDGVQWMEHIRNKSGRSHIHFAFTGMKKIIDTL